MKSQTNYYLQRVVKAFRYLSFMFSVKAFHEDMLSHLMSYKQFKDYARQVIAAHPHLTGDIDRHLRQVTGTWMSLEGLLLPNANHSDNMKMLQGNEINILSSNFGPILPFVERCVSAVAALQGSFKFSCVLL